MNKHLKNPTDAGRQNSPTRNDESQTDSQLQQLRYDLRSYFNVMHAALELSQLHADQTPKLLDIVRDQPKQIAGLIEEYCIRLERLTPQRTE